MEDLKKSINKPNMTDTHQIRRSTVAEYTCYWSAVDM